MKSPQYSERFYRRFLQPEGLVGFPVVIGESDLYILAERDLTDEAFAVLTSVRQSLQQYILSHPEFFHSLTPVEVFPPLAPVIEQMARAAQLAGVGPMAAVAGAIAEIVGRHLLNFSSEVMVENGGDIFLKIRRERRLKIYPGKDNQVNLLFRPEQTPGGIATSSGKLGHSLSFGNADAVTIIAESGALADAVATATANRVRSAGDIAPALKFALNIKGVRGAVIVVDNQIGIQGDVQLI